MVGGSDWLRQDCRASASRLGKTYRSESDRSSISDWKIRYRHVDPQRDLNRSDEFAWGNLLSSREISRRSARRRYRLVIFGVEHRNGRARDRRDAHGRAKSSRASTLLFVVLRLGKSIRPRRRNSTARILF